jgi:hypothetical protein
MKNNVHRLAIVIALAVVALGSAGVLFAEDAKELSLSGALSATEDGSYVLVERESGERISVRGPDELADHVGSEVKVTGQWIKDDEGQEYFWVKAIEQIG